MWLSKWDLIFIESRGAARSAQNFRRGAGRFPTAVTDRMAALPALKSYFFLLPRVDFGRQAAMGQPPQLGHFTSKMSVSITVAAPNSGLQNRQRPENPDGSGSIRTPRRNGTVNLFVTFDPHRGWGNVKVTDRRAAVDYAHCMRELV